MSGTWRSRHWRQDDTLPPDSSRQNQNSGNEWGNRTDGHVARASEEHSRDELRRDRGPQQQQNSNDGVESQWRRGQRLPSPPRDRDASNSRTKDGRSQQQRQYQTGVKREPTDSSSSTDKKRASFAAPANAWGKIGVQSVQTSVNQRSNNAQNSSENGCKQAVANSALAKKPVRGWTKLDPIASSNDNTTVSKKQPDVWGKPEHAASKSDSNTITKNEFKGWAKPESASSAVPAAINEQLKSPRNQSRQQNPWAKPEVATSKTPNESVFPSLSNSGESRKATTQQHTAPLSLPTTSLWGKSHSRSAIGDSKTSEDSCNTKQAKAEEFPSLSASTAPRFTQQSQSFSASSSQPVSSGNEQAKGKGQKKPTNLASFLPPQLSGSTNKKKALASRSKTTSTKTVTAIKKSTGVKRTVAPSITNPSRSFHPSMIKDTGAPALKKGRQRLTPKKKKLTTLKKRVLEERLRVWKERNEGSLEKTEEVEKTGAAVPPSVNGGAKSSSILVENFIRPEEDDLTDEDEYDELLSNVQSLAGRVGQVVSVYVPRPGAADDTPEDELSKTIASMEPKYVGCSFVKFSSSSHATAGREILNDIVVGGQKIRVSILELDNDGKLGNIDGDATTDLDDRKWRLAVLKSMDKRPHSIKRESQSDAINVDSEMVVESSASNTIIFHNILTDDDYDDEDALNESVEDISSLDRQYGHVLSVRSATSGMDKGNVYVSFSDSQAAMNAVQEMNGIMIGGSRILVSTQAESPHFKQQIGAVEVILENVLNDNDFEDDDCLHESIQDISNLARRHGLIGRVYADTTGEHKGRVHVEYLEGKQAAHHAAQQINGMLIGGLAVTATVLSSDGHPNTTDKSSAEDQTPPPIYSGDKIIPERFAACKRVPKIPNSGPRSYAVKINDERALPLLVEMLGELMRLQERSKDDKNARARRRLVMGLREVARGIRAHKVKMVVMANNLDEYGAIDAKLQEILEIARAEDVPVVFEFNKRKLGKAIGKSIKVSVVGVQSADGAQEQFKKLRKILGLA